MKKCIKTLALLFMPWLCVAQLSGTVTDVNTKEKLSGAVVSIQHSFLMTVTDAEGKFSFPGLKGTLATMTVTRLGYENYSKELLLPDERAEILLQPKSYLMEEAVVTATRASKKSPTAFTNLNGEEIQKQNTGRDVPYLLNSTPSVVVTSDAGTGIGYTGIRIRGSDATRVNVTINGIPVNDAESHQVYWVDMPDIASSVDNIQIQRGLGTSTNGGGAFGASINIQTSTSSAEPFGGVSSSAGSFNTLKNTVTFGTGRIAASNQKKGQSEGKTHGSGAFAVDGRFSKITSDGYIDRSTSDLKSFYLSGGYYGNKNTLRAVVFSGKEKTDQAWYGVPEDSLKTNRTYNPAGEYYDESGALHYYNNQTDNYQQDYYQLLYSHSAGSNLLLNAALHYTKGRGYYEEYKSKNDAYGEGNLSTYGLGPVVINGDTIETTDIIRQLQLDNDFYGITYSANYETNKLLLTFGGACNRYEGRHYDQLMWMKLASPVAYPYVYNDNSATKDDFNSFLKIIYSINTSFHLYGDFQYRTVQYSFLGFDNEFAQLKQKTNLNFVNPKGGIFYDLNPKNKVYASVAVGHKEPMRDDYVQSSPASRPKAEQMTDIEAGYKFISSSIRAEINFYSMSYADQLILTGKINDVGAYTRQNVSKSYRRGIELEAAWIVCRNLKLSGNLTVSENKIQTFEEYIDSSDDAGNYTQMLVIHKTPDISFSPSVIGAGIIGYSPAKNLNIELVAKYVGKQYLDNTSDENKKLNSYLIHDLRINYHIPASLFRDIELKIAVYNLFDKKYESNGYTYSYYYNGVLYSPAFYYPQAGINWMGGVSFKF